MRTSIIFFITLCLLLFRSDHRGSSPDVLSTTTQHIYLRMTSTQTWHGLIGSTRAHLSYTPHAQNQVHHYHQELTYHAMVGEAEPPPLWHCLSWHVTTTLGIARVCHLCMWSSNSDGGHIVMEYYKFKAPHNFDGLRHPDPETVIWGRELPIEL